MSSFVGFVEHLVVWDVWRTVRKATWRSKEPERRRLSISRPADPMFKTSRMGGRDGKGLEEAGTGWNIPLV